MATNRTIWYTAPESTFYCVQGPSLLLGRNSNDHAAGQPASLLRRADASRNVAGGGPLSPGRFLQPAKPPGAGKQRQRSRATRQGQERPPDLSAGWARDARHV